MAFEDKFRLSSHAVITNSNREVLLLNADYGSGSWGLPGGAFEPQETMHEALKRECLEEIGCSVVVKYLSGVYYHHFYGSQAFIFRCEIPCGAVIRLSHEHSDYRFWPIDCLSKSQKQRVQDCLTFNGQVVSAKF